MADNWRLRVIRRKQVCGAAILLDSGHALTCAHVVNTALGKNNSAHRPTAHVIVDFFGLGARSKATVVEGGWFFDSSGPLDLAVLRLHDPPPDEAEPAALTGVFHIGATVRAYGFPQRLTDGVWTECRIMGHGGPSNKWVQIDAIYPVGRGVEAGFSGAGVVDPQSGNLIGMIVSADRVSRTGTAWMVPVPSIVATWPGFDRFVRIGKNSDPASDPRLADISHLVSLLDDVPMMADPVTRRRLIDMLRPELSSSILWTSIRRDHVERLIRNAYDLPGGLAEVVDVLRPETGAPNETMQRFLDAAHYILIRRDEGSPQADGHSTSDQETTSGADVTSPNPTSVRPLRRGLRPALVGGLPPRNPRFTGREEMLSQIRDELRLADSTALMSQPRLGQNAFGVGLQGPPGVGKTQTAIEFAYRYASDYDVVWWVHAQEPWLVRRSLASLAQRLGLQQSIDIEQTVATVLDALRLGRPYRDWLLIFDMADEPDDVLRYVPQDGNVLITSRNSNWSDLAPTIKVDVFTPQESIDLLSNYRLNLTDESASALATRLGHLPLAVDQAANWQATTGMPVSDYIRLLDGHLAQILNEGGDDEDASVTATFKIAFEGLEHKSPGAGELLTLCSSLSAEPISIPMLLRGGKAELPPVLAETMRDDIPLRRAVREITRAGLATLDRRRDTLQMHSLIQAVRLDLLPEEAGVAMANAAHRVLAWANPSAPDDYRRWADQAQLTPHVMLSETIHSSDPQVRRLVVDQIRYLYSQGDYAGSRGLGERAVEAWETQFDPSDELTIAAQRHLANSLRRLGENTKSRELNEKILTVARDKLGETHELTLAITNSIGADMRLLGEFDRARTSDERNLQRHQEKFGLDDRATLRSANNLAVDLRMVGDYQGALALDEQTVLRSTEVFGDEDQETLLYYTNLVRDLLGLGDYGAALELQKEKLDVLENLLKKDVIQSHDYNLLLGTRNLAILFRKMGRYDEALAKAEANFHLYVARFGPDHEHTLSAMITYLNTLRVTGGLTAALTLAQDARGKYCRTFGPQHPLTLYCTVDLAIVLRALGRVEEARKLDEATLAELRSRLGPDHPYSLNCASNLANDLAELGVGDAAYALSLDTTVRSRRTRVKGHPHTLACEANLSIDMRSNGHDAEGRTLFMATLERMRQRLGPEHPETVNVERGRRTEAEIEPPPT